MNSNSLAPIALFVYNRPLHTLKLLESLRQNQLVEHCELHVFCDGPKYNISYEEREKIYEVHKLVDGIDFVKKVWVYKSEQNKGLAKSIFLGVKKIFEETDSIIVLEDDLILSPVFIKFMNKALNEYKDHSQIMHIGAYMPPIKGNFREVVLIQLTHSWGWATWSDRWVHFQPDSFLLLKEIKERGGIFKFNYDGSFNFYRMLRRNAKGERDSWLINWYATIFLRGGLCLNSSKSLVQNMGHDSTGTHSYSTNTFNTPITLSLPDASLTNFNEDLVVRKSLIRFFWKMKFKDGLKYYFQLLKKKIL